MCVGWKRLFEIQYVVYRELVIEFLAMVAFCRKISAMENRNITFCLGGEWRELSLVELAIRTEIYLPNEVHTDSYLEFITGSIKVTKAFKAETYWRDIANGAYHKGTAQETDIQSPIHRLLHRLITNTINQRQEGDTVTTLDVFFPRL